MKKYSLFVFLLLLGLVLLVSACSSSASESTQAAAVTPTPTEEKTVAVEVGEVTTGESGHLHQDREVDRRQQRNRSIHSFCV